ncbi:acetamidase/formamidase family protein [Mangrovibrevibacter kandeliae]|uniref:acetamidase/formamidase family protein n=1 Tax=Mangrovibrevibacter kandeliae TaxID=2968473 RepID=UPI00211851D6|nr:MULTISPECIES: acetamidase/formamidase family protein [unclassified Aurantimonas]MCQ8781591.1 acetamidase/formamidase family protein [Aurantimonas sp. CSK15Z-1]MCW4114963.1 acetamidase/formamidase family protein [Aurantimonas sp. MSK8Z-1]
MKHHSLPVSPQTVHWGYFSKAVAPALTVTSGDRVTIETLTHHANDDYERMIAGDSAAEAIFHWTAEEKTIARRGAGPTEGPFRYGSGEGVGVHLMTGPVAVEGAEAGDILEVRVLDVRPRPSASACYCGRCFGSNAAASWGFQYKDLIEEPKPREVVTIFELDTSGEPFAKAVYNYVWTPQTDPDGIVHPTIDYPGVRVDHTLVRRRENILQNVRVPARLHFGTMGLAPAESDYVSSIPPSYTGGNIDDWRIGKGARMYYPVAVDGAFFSVGDPHAAQGDSELGGTAIETSLTGDFEFVLHKRADLGGTILEGLCHPMLETAEQWSVYGFTFANYLAELGPAAQTEVGNHASIDRAMRDAFRKLRRFLMTAHKLSEDEAIALMSVAADFGVTQVVDANWGVHGSIRKEIFRCTGV